MEIKCTTDYSIFKKFNGNRRITNWVLVNTMAEFMKRVGFIVSQHITVNRNMEVLDGQHRLEAAKIAGVCVYYVIDDQLTLSTVQEAGAFAQKWTAIQYIQSYAESGNPNYKKLLELYESIPYDASGRGKIIDRCSSMASVGFYGLVKSGEFEVTDKMENTINDVISKLSLFDKHNPNFLKGQKSMGAALALILNPGYQHENMKNKMEYLSTRLVRCGSCEEYTNLLYDIYNHKLRVRLEMPRSCGRRK